MYKQLSRERVMSQIVTKTAKRQKTWLVHVFWLWLITGGVYYIIEGLWHIPTNGGWGNIAMAPIGGLCGVLIGMMNENTKFARKKMIVQAVYGAALLVLIEFICGYIMNIVLGMNVWDYSALPFNFMGQISLRFAILWFLFTPFIIWFDDFLRHRLWNEGKKYPWYQNYIKLIKLQ